LAPGDPGQRQDLHKGLFGPAKSHYKAGMQAVRVRVPATTANVGPGFDCLGIALQISNVVTVRNEPGGPADGFVTEAAGAFFRRAGRAEFPFSWKVTGQVPRSRGLGSSVTVRLGLLHGLNVLAGGPLTAQVLYELCAELEGHPDNAAPAAFGGFTIARPGTGLQRYRVGRTLQFGLVIPDFEVATPEARRALPATIPFADAALSTANACAVAGAFASRDYAKLAGCFQDRLHQPYREKLVPFLSRVLAAGEAAGAIGGWLSGSGSTIACAVLGDAAPVAEAMRAASGNPGARVLTTRADNHGVRILPG
jgi:homoserine kinase